MVGVQSHKFCKELLKSLSANRERALVCEFLLLVEVEGERILFLFRILGMLYNVRFRM